MDRRKIRERSQSIRSIGRAASAQPHAAAGSSQHSLGQKMQEYRHERGAGTTSSQRLTVISTRPAGLPPIVMSKKTTGLAMVSRWEVVSVCCGVVWGLRVSLLRLLFFRRPVAGRSSVSTDAGRRQRTPSPTPTPARDHGAIPHRSERGLARVPRLIQWSVAERYPQLEAGAQEKKKPERPASSARSSAMESGLPAGHTYRTPTETDEAERRGFARSLSY